LCCLFFSFFPSSYHRYLHSFPTRRSSDLAYHVPVTDLELGGLAVVLFVLRHSTNRTKPVENVVPAYGGVPIDDAMRSNLCSRPDAHAGPHDAVRTDGNVFSQFGLRRDNGGGMDTPGHQSSSARMAHISFAAATSWPSTVARALYLHMVRLRRSAETSSRNWSPGTTGLRNLAPSTPTR